MGSCRFRTRATTKTERVAAYAELEVVGIEIENNRIVFDFNGKEVEGYYLAYVGFFNRLIKRGEILKATFCKWDSVTWQPAWSENTDSSIWRYEVKGEDIVKSSGLYDNETGELNYKKVKELLNL